MKFLKSEKDLLNKIYFPNKYIDKIIDINSDFFVKENIKGVVIDIDNTVINKEKSMIDGLVEWSIDLKENNIKLIILSNTGFKAKVKKIAKLLDVDYYIFAMKPNKRGYIKVKNNLDLPFENICMIGDQIFTDVLGANKLDMFSILVNPIEFESEFFTIKWKRPTEDKVLINYLKHVKEKKQDSTEYLHILDVLDKRIKKQNKLKKNKTNLAKIIEEVRKEK